MANNRDVAKEVRDEYVDTVSKILFSYVKSYSGRLAKLQFEEVATREDLMGADDAGGAAVAARVMASAAVGGISGIFKSGSGQSKGTNRASVFAIGSRGRILSQERLEAPMIVPHSQQQTEAKVSLKREKVLLSFLNVPLTFSSRSRSFSAASSFA